MKSFSAFLLCGLGGVFAYMNKLRYNPNDNTKWEITVMGYADYKGAL